MQPLKGFRELSPEDFLKKKRIVERSRELFRLYGYEEVEIPTVEPSALIELKSGEEIRHRMFKFKDLGGRSVVLRPEGTPSVARYVVTKLRGKPFPVRLSYVSNMFRYDEPQRGRFREFTHVGFELFGSDSPLADMEILEVTSMLLSGLGFVDFEVKMGDQGTLRAVLEKFGIRGSLQDRLLGMIDRNEEKEV
ncbi:MAG TPA: ATP phosphoribosyltransferase regulatory subunit, partial [Thermoproteota archaeon]|nr:ATP phosphoribosyltransferase regulatory subunit [Thermoproteota archaeon]